MLRVEERSSGSNDETARVPDRRKVKSRFRFAQIIFACRFKKGEVMGTMLLIILILLSIGARLRVARCARRVPVKR